MRVIHVAPTSFGENGLLGGGERYPLELAAALASEVSCELVVFGANQATLQPRKGLTVRIVRPMTHLRSHPAHPFTLALPRLLRGADIVHTHHMRSTPSRIAAVTARARGQRLAVTDHGLGGGGWGGMLPRMFDRFLVVSKFSAGTLTAPPAKTKVIYGGADPTRYAPEEGVSRRGVLFVGRLTPHKGIDRLIAALPEGASLSIVGSGGHDRAPPERDYPQLLQELAAGKDVSFLGALPDDDVRTLYRRAEVFVLPSVERTCYGRHIAISELLGLAVIEAMASGTPVVCSRIGGLPEVVRDGETGFLVPPGDVDALRDRLSTLLRDRRLAQRMGANARALVLERFTWQHCARRCLAAYEEMVKGAL